MNDTDMITLIFASIDDIVKSIKLDPKPGPKGKLSESDEVKQLENILEDLKDKWLLADLGYRGKDIHKRFWDDKQIAIKLTGGKERQWIENVIGFLKDKLGLSRIRGVRKTPAFLARVYSMLCAYNLCVKLNLSI